MSILTIENISFGFDDKMLLKDISFRLLKGEHVGLVGANGVGKTTFFDILTGRLIADKGKVSRPSTIKIGYLDQYSQLQEGYSIKEVLKSAFSHLYQIEKDMLEVGIKLAKANKDEIELLLNQFGKLQDSLYAGDFYLIDHVISQVAGGLGLDALGMDTLVENLSGGQRMKIKLAKLLLENPDLLLLDEPTNYLDQAHVDWLGQYLENYSNSFIVISHDTYFLNRITNVIYHIEFSYVNRYVGNYDTFLKLKDEEQKRYIQSYNRQQKTIKKLETFINKNIVRASTTKRAQSRRKQLKKIQKLEKPQVAPNPFFSFTQARESTDVLFKSSDMALGYQYPILEHLDLKLTKGKKIAITGCNGIGKSTLLKTIMGVISPLSGTIEFGDYLHPVYYEQEIRMSSLTPLEWIWNTFPKKNQREIREALARCGLKEAHVLRELNSLSGGEQSKVRLCKLLMTPSNWLLLDEPTNHLDAHAKSALKEGLIKYDGSILLICHEKEFYKDWITDVWDLEKLSLKNYGYSQQG